jgi:exodeoxyribonuclease VII small subunit
MTTPSSVPDSVAADWDGLSYEDARDQLVAVVAQLETGGVSLEESVRLWERGEQLARVCQQRLDGVRARLDAVARSRGDEDDGQPAQA